MYDIYDSENGDQWRYLLGSRGKKPLLVIGLNPSTATREKADPTVARIQRVAERNGYDGFVMLNLYPVRATKFEQLPVDAERGAYIKNLEAIERVVAATAKPEIWAAWGQPVTRRRYFVDARDDLVTRLTPYKPKWLRFGALTKTGHPRHPSRLDYQWVFEPYDVEL